MDFNETLVQKNLADHEQDVIILDDDDFIQTTLNLFNPMQNLPHYSATENLNSTNGLVNDIMINNPEGAMGFQITHLQNENSSQMIDLIDLTSCDDFDLDNLFLMNSSTSSNNPVEFNSCSTNEVELEKKMVKNEFDFKVFNFNFGNSIEEILIDDEEEEDEDEDDEDDEELEEDEEQTHENELKKIENSKTQSMKSASDSSSFTNYRIINDSSSESSSTKKNIFTKQFKCNECSKVFGKLYNFKRHMFMHQTASSDSNANQAGAETGSGSIFKINECQYCKKRILDNSNFSKHLKICSQKKFHVSPQTENFSKIQKVKF